MTLLDVERWALGRFGVRGHASHWKAVGSEAKKRGLGSEVKMGVHSGERIFLAIQGVEKTGQKEISGLWLLAGSVVAAVLLEKVAGEPLEQWRQNRTTKV